MRIEPGELVSVVGPSGSGKSTFLQLVGLLDSPSAGSIRFDGRDVGSLADRDRTAIRLEELGFVFQRFHLLNHLTALDNVMLPMEAAGVALERRYLRATELLTTVACAIACVSSVAAVGWPAPARGGCPRGSQQPQRDPGG